MPTSKQRRDAERRRLQRQLARRQERAVAQRRNTLIVSVVGAIVVIGLVVFFIVQTGSDNAKPKKQAAHHTPKPTPSSSTSASRIATYPCDWTKSGKPARPVTEPATAKPPKTGKVNVAVHTNQGDMTFTLDRAAAPCTVASFVSLVQQKFYDKTTCDRLTTAASYILQCGDPTKTGSGGPGYSIPDEATGKETYPAGAIAMARTRDPHSGGSQFFIVYKNSPYLMQGLGQQQYTVFGHVTSGLGVVSKIAAAGQPPGGDGAPQVPVNVISMTTAKR